MKLINPFAKSWFRHLLQTLLALGLVFFLGNNMANKNEIKELRSTIEAIAKQPKTSVKNNIDHVKVKDGSTLDFAPRTQIERDFDSTEPRIRDPVNFEKQTPILSQETKLKILKLEIHLNKLIDGNRRKKKQRKLKAEIHNLRNPP